MDPRLIELYVQRGRLRERIGSQRSQVARDLAPLGRALAGVDRARAGWHQAKRWVVAHPVGVTAGMVALLVWQPRRVFRAVRWGYVSWRQWARVRQWLSDGIKTL
jgi:hypothetical protein